MKASIGIMAYNEEANIGNLLKTLLNQKLDFVKEIIVVNDGSTDKTAGIVQKFLKNKKIKLINLKKRSGKVNAINRFLKIVKSEVVILESADTIPEKNAIKNLITEFKDQKIGIIGAHIIPINKEGGFANFFGSFIYQLHHEIALKNPKFGELIAFRNIIRRLPMNAVDEECLAMLIKEKGYTLEYCPEAIVYNKQPTSIKELIIQRRRIHAGHTELKVKYKYKPSTSNTWRTIGPVTKKINIKNAHFILTAVMLEIYIKMLGYYDYYLKKEKHYAWEIATSTKEFIA